MRTVDPERHAARRARILAVAAEVFATHGYDATSTAAICRHAGIGSGTLFHYFGDKRSILAAMVADDAVAQRASLDAVDLTDARRALDAVVDVVTADLADPLAPGLTVAMMQLALRDHEFAAQLAAMDAHARELLSGAIGTAQRAGMADASLDPERAARWVLAAVDGAYLLAGDDEFDPVADPLELRRLINRYLARSDP